MALFVWTKMQAAGGESLDRIVLRKEAERCHGGGEFWWGIGNSLGSAIDAAAAETEGNIPVLFSRMLSRPKRADSHPRSVCVWNGWIDRRGRSGRIPEHVLVTGGAAPDKAYYALACRSDHELAIGNHGLFDPGQCRTALGKVPGSSQVTCLLRDLNPGAHRNGPYRLGFQAALVFPWAVKLAGGRLLSETERARIDQFGTDDDWLALVRDLRGR